MSASLKHRPATARSDADAESPIRRQPQVGPSRRRRRASNRLGKVVALCAMGAWAVVGLMPVIAALYAIYGY